MQYTNSYFTLDIEGGQVFMNFYPAVSGGEELKIAEINQVLEKNKVKDFDIQYIGDTIRMVEQPMRFVISTQVALQFNESMSVKITPDGMYAIARFFPPSNKGKRMTEAEIKNDLAYAKIRYGIKESEIQKHLMEPEYFKNILIAVGTKPIQGRDGFITYKFNTDRKAKPRLKEDGTVDFHQLDNIAHVKKGDVLAVLTPVDRGTPGCNVYGNEVRPDKVRKVIFSKGNNITTSEDGLRLISDVDGFATLEGDKVFVSNLYEVPADVDNSTGDIEFNGGVIVKGNVRTGFKVKAAGNIEVFGVVEGAELDAGGDVILHRGIQGMSRCRIKAHGNLVSKFIESANVYVDGNINADSILNSQVSAHGDIVVTGKGGNIIGGNVRSTTLIEATTIGTAMGVATTVEVGIDPTIKDRLKEIDEDIKNKTAEVNKLDQLVTVFRKKQSMGILEPDKLKMISQFTKTIILNKAEIKELNKERETKMSLASENENARIKVLKDIHQGTRVTVSGELLILKDKYSHCQYMKKDGEVVSSIW